MIHINFQQIQAVLKRKANRLGSGDEGESPTSGTEIGLKGNHRGFGSSFFMLSVLQNLPLFRSF